jgi:tetratricopeptide (TPR) repeat protein
MAQDHMLQEAMDAARDGKRSHARDLLTRLLRANQNNVDYWLGLSSVVDSTKEQIYCLEKALEIDPDNEVAQRGLVLLGGRPADENLVPIKPDRKRDWDIGKIGSISGVDEKDKSKKAPIPVARLLALGSVAAVAFGLIYFGVFNNPLSSPNTGIGSDVTRQPLGSGGPTPTFMGEEGPEEKTPLPTFAGPTPLSMLLDEPYTATPRYVNTAHPSTAAYRSAMNAFDMGNWDTAIDFLEQALEIEPEAPDLRYHLGIAYINIEEYFEAKKLFLQAANIDPGFGAAYMGMAMADLALGLEGELLEELDDAIQNDPELGEAFIQRAIYRLSRGNSDGALDDLRRAEDQSSNSAYLYLTLAKVFLVVEQFEDALAAAQQSMAIDITIVETYWILAQAHHALDNTREVISPIQTYLLYEEENGQAWFILGQALVAERYYKNALNALEEALVLEPTLGEVNFYRGFAYLELEDYENALRYLKNSTNNFPRWFEPNINYGRAIFESGDVAEGYKIINYSSAFAKTPQQYAVLHYWLAISLEALGDDKTALREWEDLLMLSTDVVPREWESLARSRLQDAGIPIPSRTPAAPTKTPAPTSTPTSTPTPSATPQ